MNDAKLSSTTPEKAPPLEIPKDVTIRQEILNLAAGIDAAPATNPPKSAKEQAEKNLSKMVGHFEDVTPGSITPPTKDDLGKATFDNALKDLLEIQSHGTVGKIATDIVFAIAYAIRPLFTVMPVVGMMNDRYTIRDARKTIRPTLLDKSAYLEYLKRNPSQIDTVKDRLGELGYPDELQSILLELSNNILSVNETVSLATRGAFNDSFAAEWGLDSGLSSVEGKMRPLVEKAGGVWEHIKYFWRTHWTFPSGATLNDLLHHKKLTVDQVKHIMRAQNIPEKLIDSLIDISHTPLSVVQLRRLFNADIISDISEVEKAYRILGYDEQNAKRLAALADLLKKTPKKVHSRQKEVASGDILSAYTDSILTEREAREMLKDLTYTSDEIDFLISHEDYKIQRERAQILISAYRKAYMAGVYSDNDVAAKLGQLNIPTSYSDTLLEAWQIEKINKAERPSKSEILSFLHAGIIDEATARAELSHIGYDRKYIQWYIEAAERALTTKPGGHNATATSRP